MALRGLLLVDANVLVDYLAAGVELLGLVARAVGPIHVVSTVLAEVEDFDADGCARVGIRVVEPTLAQAREAAEPAGRLSFADRLCLVVCRERGWVCVSNDKALRRACEAARVDVLWGLELLVELVTADALSAAHAVAAAERMHAANPFFLNEALLDAFRAKLDTLARR